MATLIIENVSPSLFDRIQDQAKSQRRSAADAVLDALEIAFRESKRTEADADRSPFPQAPFLTEDRGAFCTLPRPRGESVVPQDIVGRLPEPHDISNEA